SCTSAQNWSPPSGSTWTVPPIASNPPGRSSRCAFSKRMPGSSQWKASKQTTASNGVSGGSQLSNAPTTTSTGNRCSLARATAASRSPSSTQTSSSPRSASGSVARPVPQPISSTRFPGASPPSRTRSSKSCGGYGGRARSYCSATVSKVRRRRWRSCPPTPAGLFGGGRAYLHAREARAQAKDGLRVKLGDARLGDAQHVADLTQGQLLVVVERDHDLLALGQGRDRLGERLPRLRLVERCLRLGPLGVLDRVDQRHLVAARGRDRPDLVEGCDRRARDVREAVLELLLGDPDLLGDLLVRRGAVELSLERRHRALDLTRARADRARHPVHGAQLVDDCALDPRDRERLELDVAVRVVALDRADQAR